MTSIRFARPEDVAAIAHCHIAAWRDTYRPIVAEQYLSSLVPQDHVVEWAKRLQQPECHTLVAESSSHEIVGFVHGGPERTGRTDFCGEIYSIYILREFRRQGIGKRLFLGMTDALREDKIESVIVWALEGNQYRACYAAWGGEQVAVGPIRIGQQDLVEVAYGWSDTTTFDARLS
jgi:ribosomal protein S18 acetylase RimI-like enzyme